MKVRLHFRGNRNSFGSSPPHKHCGCSVKVKTALCGLTVLKCQIWSALCVPISFILYRTHQALLTTSSYKLLVTSSFHARRGYYKKHCQMVGKNYMAVAFADWQLGCAPASSLFSLYTVQLSTVKFGCVCTSHLNCAPRHQGGCPLVLLISPPFKMCFTGIYLIARTNRIEKFHCTLAK